MPPAVSFCKANVYLCIMRHVFVFNYHPLSDMKDLKRLCLPFAMTDNMPQQQEGTNKTYFAMNAAEAGVAM